mmetsp:Transcript_15525/g.18877  ORF Transcript_15525/g.18877 Transcript_15525/m.18877 type:complete len:565 (+) Transcript_15525:93-1787(+)
MTSTYDPDTLLKIRKDFRMMKVYTIDSSSTSEIDDGISIQAFTDPTTGDLRKRYWIHIADADRWAPRNSRILEAAKQRSTSIYLPNRSYSMFPSKLASGVMSLKHTVDTCALSLGVEVDPVDGSIVEESIVVTPSLVRVSYRLTYDQVDEMLEEGVGYNEEWELGSMVSIATKRRKVRIEKSSLDRLLSVKIPQVTPRVVFKDESESVSRELDENDDNVAISLNIEVSNNGGRNSTSGAEEATATIGNGAISSKIQEGIPDVSPANLLVTEMMIMANEALGRWGVQRSTESKEEKEGGFIDLPYRSQAAPLFSERPTEYEHFMKLQSEMVGGGYCAAWYMRRFSTPVSVSSEPMPHAAMGLDYYVQWTSPIRRYSDLQVQAVVKRYLRRKQVLELLRDGQPVPSQISATDLGGLGKELRLARNNISGDEGLEDDNLFTDMSPINYKDGTGLIKAARFVQNGSNEYWMLEYIKRLKQKAKDDIEFECMVLGCFNEEKQLYSIFIHEIAFEYKYRSEKGQLNPGDTIWLTPMDINPRMGLMTLTLSARSRGLKQTVSQSTKTARAA